MQSIEEFSNQGFFVFDMPYEERPMFEAWALERGCDSVSFLSVKRPVKDYGFRFLRVAEPKVVVWADHVLSLPDIKYMQDNGLSILRVYKIEDGFVLKEGDLNVELTKHPERRPENNEAIGEKKESFDHLLFSGTRDEDSRSNLNRASFGVTRDSITADDITMVICVRAHEANPWLLDRLHFLGEAYSPRPKISIIDFGSDLEYSEKIEDICENCEMQYTYVDDKDVFSLAKARNIGADRAETELLFFSDIDFVFPYDFFEDLANQAAVLAAKSRIDILLMCAAYHLSEQASSEFVRIPDSESRSDFLKQIGYSGVYEKFGRSAQFVAPYSNVYLISKNLFSLAGGYCEEFRGHGSEDFEFISRINYYTNHYPVPEEILSDTGGASKKSFFEHQEYKGFRALNSMTALPGLLRGLNAYHLYHPTPNDSWRTNNDWRRSKMSEVMGKYVGNPERLLEIDFMPRAKKALCVCLHKDHWGYFTPLRMAGYETIPVYDGAVKCIEEASQMILSGEVDALAVYNPYMDSHRRIRGLFYLAKSRCETFVIERGALPNTIYFSDDVAYNSEEYSDERFHKYSPSNEEYEVAQRYISNLRSGEKMLEAGAPYDFTTRKYTPIKESGRSIVFIPLQMSEDMAVTLFLRDAQRYGDFAASIAQIAADHPEIIFVVKPHPLSKETLPLKGANIVIADREDNIHALIELSNAVIAYNSGVSLLAMAHDKPVWTVGNAYFNKGGAGKVAHSLKDAVVEFEAGNIHVDPAAIRRVYAWLLCRMYSGFSATDSVREFKDRKAHGYKDVVVTDFRLNEVSYNLTRARSSSVDVKSTLGYALLNFG